MLLLGICPLYDYLCCRMPVYGKMQLILHHSKEITGSNSRRGVINGCCIDICYLLIKLAFTGTYLTYLIQQMVKI